MKLKKGDEVIILSGKDKNKKGKIDKVDHKNETVLLAGLNQFKRHLKKRDERNTGGIINFSRPLPAAKVALVCPKCGKPTRVGFIMNAKQKERICKKCEARI